MLFSPCHHMWLQSSLSNPKLYSIGLTKYFIKYLGDIIYLDISKNPEKLFNKDEVFATVESCKAVNDLMMPFSGRIIELTEINPKNIRQLNLSPEISGI